MKVVKIVLDIHYNVCYTYALSSNRDDFAREMIRRLRKYGELVAVVLMLAPFSFCFYYCELADCANAKTEKSPLDFCTIIKVTNVQTDKVVANDSFKLKVEKYFTPHLLDAISIQNISIDMVDINLFHPPKKPTQLFLSNSTLLI